MVDVGSLNPFAKFDIGIGTIGSVLLVFFLAIFILGLIIVAIFLYINNKKYKYKIPLYKKIGINTIRIAKYKAKDFSIGKAGDKLWFVRKVKKYLPPASVQTAPNEYTHFERSDGEWINISMPDIDVDLKKLKVKYVHQDMRSNRIAIANLLDQRFADKKSWWEKYGNLVTHLIFYMVVTIMMVVIFYQWSDIVTKISGLVGQLQTTQKACGGGSIVPALIFLFRRKR